MNPLPLYAVPTLSNTAIFGDAPDVSVMTAEQARVARRLLELQQKELELCAKATQCCGTPKVFVMKDLGDVLLEHGMLLNYAAELLVPCFPPHAQKRLM